MKLPDLFGGVFASMKSAARSAILSAIATLSALAFAPSLLADAPEAKPEHAFDAIINAAAKKHSVDPLLIKAVIWNESRFQPRARGSAGEIGLMQLRSGAIRDWAEETGKPFPSREQLYDPYVNIEIGSWFLGRALARWDGKSQCYALALCEYNAGYSRASYWRARTARDAQLYIASAKTRHYVTNVRDKYLEYSAESAAYLARNLHVDAEMLSLRAVAQ